MYVCQGVSNKFKILCLLQKCYNSFACYFIFSCGLNIFKTIQIFGSQYGQLVKSNGKIPNPFRET